MTHLHIRQYLTASRLQIVGVATLLAGAIIVIYLPALHGGFIWDDDAHVTRPELRSLHGLWRIWFDLGATQQYYPLLHSAFWFEHELWGDLTLGYHLLNILLHASAVCLLLLTLRRLRIPGAFLATAIFALHPVYVESVAWITEQKNTLSAVFYLSAMLVYLRFDQERRTLRYVQAFSLFVLGLLTKTVVATLPGALLVIFWWQRGRLSPRRDVLPLIPWFLLGGVAGLLTAWIERKLIGAQGAPFDLTLLQRCLLAGRVIWFYLGKLLWPVDLLFIYPLWDLNPIVWWQYLFPLGAVALLVMLWLIRRRWRGPLAGLLFFIGSLFPVLGFLNVYPFVYSFVADHFQYLASLGIIVVASAALALVLERVPPPVHRAGQALCMIVLAVLAVLTWRQSRMYSDVHTLYEATLRSNPRCWMCQINLGLFRAAIGQEQAAIEHYQEVIRLRPNSAVAAVADNNTGIALAHAGRLGEAINHYEQALQILPDYGYAHYNMGSALLKAGLLAEARRHCEQALRITPNFAEAHYMLGYVLFQMGKLPEAKEQYAEALRINPNYGQARDNLSLLQGEHQDTEPEN